MSKPERLIDDDLKKTKDTSELRKLYYDKKTGLSSFDKLWRKVKKQKLDFTQKEVKDWLAKQRTTQLTKEFRKPKKFTTIRAPEPGTNLQMDLMFFMPKIKNKTGVLNVIDVHSRKAFSEVIANKKEATVLTAFHKILAEIEANGKTVKHMNSDEGTEFTSVWRLLRQNGVTIHKSRKQEYAKNAIVERFNRTIRNVMKRYETQFPRAELVNDWDQLIANYNESYHSTIKAEPGEVWDGDDKNTQEYNDIKYDFKVGNQVRVLYKKELFEKGTYAYEPGLFTISRIPRTGDYNTLEQKHFVKDEKGNERKNHYMGYELQLVEGVEDGPEYDAEKIERTGKGVEKKKAQAKQQRQLKKEGLDDAPATARKQPKRNKTVEPKSLLKRRVKIKWDGKGEMTVAAERDRGKAFDKYYPGTIERYDRLRNRFMVRYGDAKRKLYQVNLLDPKSDDYIPPNNWKFA